jgi:hypothetical protein
MRNSILAIAIAALLAVGVGQALAANSAPITKTVTVAMHDPGCHWFSVNGKYLKTLTVRGPVKLANYDEAALLVVGPAGVKRAAVGKQILLGRGTYGITMVGQAPDDNHLRLTVK